MPKTALLAPFFLILSVIATSRSIKREGNIYSAVYGGITGASILWLVQILAS